MPPVWHEFSLLGCSIWAMASGALFWPDKSLLVVSDLHLGRSERVARLGGALLPPYEARETLGRLQSDLEETGAETLICLGDSFDDDQSASHLIEETRILLVTIMRGRRVCWIAGNHDPKARFSDESWQDEIVLPPLRFRHVADMSSIGEISGHYHPKVSVSVKGRRISRACFLVDENRAILPAYGIYTGGLDCQTPPLSGLMSAGAVAILLGDRPRAIPMPKQR